MLVLVTLIYLSQFERQYKYAEHQVVLDNEGPLQARLLEGALDLSRQKEEGLVVVTMTTATASKPCVLLTW